jgi:hypothetical protein
MNGLTVNGGRRMAVKEAAGILGVTPEAIKKHIRALYPESIRNGIETTLTEVQITEIKKKMIPTTSVVGAISDLEAAEMLIKSAEHFKARFEQEHRLRIEAESNVTALEQQAAEDAPKVGYYVGEESRFSRSPNFFSRYLPSPSALMAPPSSARADSRRTITSSLTLRRCSMANFSILEIMFGGSRYPTLTNSSPSFFAFIGIISVFWKKKSIFRLTRLYNTSIMEVL